MENELPSPVRHNLAVETDEIPRNLEVVDSLHARVDHFNGFDSGPPKAADRECSTPFPRCEFELENAGLECELDHRRGTHVAVKYTLDGCRQVILLGG